MGKIYLLQIVNLLDRDRPYPFANILNFNMYTFNEFTNKLNIFFYSVQGEVQKHLLR